MTAPAPNRSWAVTEIAHPGLRDVKPDCADCFALTRDAIVTAKVTGSRGATFTKGEHSVTVSRTFAPEPPAEGAILGVVVLVVSHAHGREVSAHTSREEALERLMGYVSEEWPHEISDDVRKPRSREAMIHSYFDIVDDEEYSLTVL